MEKKEKKFYESPSMTVYEIGRTQILVGSPNGETEKLVEEDYINSTAWVLRCLFNKHG